ncbi:hypothetical protein [Ralstonia solanacearum]|uniref:hypothetical protein n=1 Tax=Ralstonia solanacearum TaxID=305 RepID=UPI001E3FC457|nr:hypothetical protein [Ralstonia solanacearum]MDC6176417.1 hypothetical protein [Ralstonia solanacearum]MDC6213338.1 hypothetical protein [Ralstonia solanacearum]MDC6237982.1 hypothetical protein [Ralstonia solanacearum]MDD7803817.1 hypothetical protein [Ralstonia solanacearum]
MEFDANLPMGNFAANEIEDVISAWLVGLHNEVSVVIPRSLEWLDSAIASGEENRFGPLPCMHRVTLHAAKAMGSWMRNSENDEHIWLIAQTAQAEYMQTGYVKVLGPDRFDYELQRFVPQEVHGLPYSSSRIVRDGLLDDFMAFAFQAGQFEQGIAEYEKHLVPKVPSLKKALKPRDFAYALCLHRAGRHIFDEADLLSSGRKMLQAHLQETWLGRGQFLRAATWLKIVYWRHDPSLTPLQTVLKAYEDMPKVPRPDFVPAV